MMLHSLQDTKCDALLLLLLIGEGEACVAVIDVSCSEIFLFLIFMLG